VANPYSTAFIFGGDSGTGKTSAAWALAADLGCSIDADPPEFGGVWSMPSGEQSADSLRTIWPGLWTIPFQSKDGWKVLIVNEVEQLNGAVERLWLDKLEDLPPQTVVIFTTNALASLPDRFVDRCIGGVIQFRGAADDLRESARALAASIWRAETGQDIPPDVLESVLVKATRAGRLSFRRVVQSLVPILAQKGKPCPS
jgi:DNA polymerase III delta prime subunit